MTPTPQTDQPSTAAGKALLRDEAPDGDSVLIWSGCGSDGFNTKALTDAILAIEAEARADTARPSEDALTAAFHVLTNPDDRRGFYEIVYNRWDDEAEDFGIGRVSDREAAQALIAALGASTPQPDTARPVEPPTWWQDDCTCPNDCFLTRDTTRKDGLCDHCRRENAQIAAGAPTDE